jgi:hypothetical protein
MLDQSAGGMHFDLEYSLPEAKRSFWSKRYPVEGKVVAYMCDGCGPIILYGEPVQHSG